MRRLFNFKYALLSLILFFGFGNVCIATVFEEDDLPPRYYFVSDGVVYHIISVEEKTVEAVGVEKNALKELATNSVLSARNKVTYNGREYQTIGIADSAYQNLHITVSAAQDEEGIKYIGKCCFKGAQGVGHVNLGQTDRPIELPYTLELLDSAAFAQTIWCTHLILQEPYVDGKKVKEGYGSLKEIGQNVFANSDFIQIQLPNSVEKVYSNTFSNSYIKTVYLYAQTPPQIVVTTDGYYRNFNVGACTLYVPKGTSNTYKNTMWRLFNIVEMDAGVDDIFLDKTPISVKYYTIDGLEILNPDYNKLYIRVSYFQNGRISKDKIIFKP